MSGLERFEGAILGAACGDALGAWTESMTPSAIKAQFGGRLATFPDAPHPYLKGENVFHFTDDTQLSLCVAESLIEKGDVDIADLADRFVTWSLSPDSARSPSLTCMRATRNLRDGVAPDQSGLPSTCGAAVARLVPFGLFFMHDKDRCREAAIRASNITHRDPSSDAAAATVALAVAHLAGGEDPDELVDFLLCHAAPYSDEFAQHLRYVNQCIGLDDEAAFNCLGRGDSLLEVVPSSLYCFACHTDDYREAIVTAVNRGGRADSVASVVGALSGCQLGISAIPVRWRNRLEKAETLKETARRLYEAACQDGNG